MADPIYDELFEITKNALTDFPEDKEKLNEVVAEGPDNEGLKNRPEKKDDDKLAEDDLVKEGLDEEDYDRTDVYKKDPTPPDEESDEDFVPPSNDERMEGLVDYEALDAAEVALTTAAESLLKEGFDEEEVVEFLSSRAYKAVENAHSDMALDKVTPGEPEDKVVPDEEE